MYKSALFLSSLLGLATALPHVGKRQAMTVTSTLPVVNGTMPVMTGPATSAVTTVVPTPTMPTPTMSGPVMPSMSMSMSASGSAASSYPAYPCPSPYLLTYVEVQETYMGFDVSAFEPYLFNWQNATYMYYINGTGGNMPGATRDLAAPNGGVHKEVLSSYTTSAPNVALELVMNLTSGPIPVGMTMLSNYSTELQVYNNATASMAGSNSTTVKLFCNFCAANQAEGMMGVSMSFQGALMNLMTLLNGGTVPATPGAMSSGMASGMPVPTMPGASMSASGMVMPSPTATTPASMMMPATTPASMMMPPASMTTST